MQRVRIFVLALLLSLSLAGNGMMVVMAQEVGSGQKLSDSKDDNESEDEDDDDNDSDNDGIDDSIDTEILVDQAALYEAGDSYFDENDNEYEVLDFADGVGTLEFVAGADKKITSLSIPESLSEEGAVFTVVSIGDKALENYKKLKEVSIPDTVTEVGKNAFRNCSKLKQVEIGSGLEKIGASAFSGDTRIAQWSLASLNLKSVGKSTFHGIYKKAVFDVPDSKVTSYKKLFRAAGLNRKVTVQ